MSYRDAKGRLRTLLRDAVFRAVVALLFISAGFVSACQSDSINGPESEITKKPTAPVNVSAFLCQARPKTLSLTCTSADDPTVPSYLIGIDPGAEPSSILIGGQHSNVDIVSSNVTNNTTTHRFAFDVTVKNLRPRPIGTTDGVVTDSSLSVAFVSGPTNTGDSAGNVSVFNPTGVAFFTQAGQPYFKYGQMLAQGQVSPAKNWILQYDPKVQSFSFLLLVSASVQYPNGYIDVFAATDSIFAGATLQMQDSVRDPLGVATADQSETWSLSSSADSAKGSINASGLLTGTSAGNVTVVATQGVKTGSKVIKIKAPATKLAVTTHASNPAQSGVVFPTQPVIQLKDASDNNVTLAGVMIHAALTSGSGTLSGTDSAATNANGAATFSGLKITGAAGPKVITYTSGALTSAVDSITLAAGPAANIVVVGGATAVAASGTVGITATVTDASANPVSGVAVTFTSTSTGTAGSFSGSNPASTNGSGVATINFVASSTAGVKHTMIGTIPGPLADTTDSIQTQGPPTAVADSAASNSSPGQSYHATFNTALNIAAPGLLSNDNLGVPAATITSFGADSLGGTVTTNSAGSTVTPLPGHANGSLTVNSNGSVAFTPPTGFTGYYVFHYRISNTVGGTPQTSDGLVKIAVGARPSASNSTYGSSLIGNVGINTSTSTNTKVTAAGDALVYNNVGATNGTGAVHSDGTYDFKPSLGFVSGNGTLAFNVKNGFGTTANATVTLPVGSSRAWFIASGGSGDGRFGTPLGCLVGAAGCLNGLTTASGDVIYIGSGTYAGTTAFTLLSNQRVIGQGATGNFADAANANLTWPADAGAQPALAGARPVLNSSGAGVLTLGSGNTIRGVLIGNSTGVSLSGSAVGTLTIGSAAIVNTTGRAIDLSTSGTLAVALDSIVATGGTGNGISLVSQSGTFTSGITKITNPSGTGINVTGSGGFSFGTAAVKKIGSSGVGINLSSNSGTTTFTTLVDSTTSGSALVASSAGTILIGGGVINANAGSAIDATSTAFSGAGFSTVNAAGGANGVSLNGVSGTLALGTGSLAGGNGFTSFGGTSATVTYAGTVTGSARPVNLANASAGACGSITLSGKITGSSNGILVQNCNAGTVTFSGPDTLSTTTNKGVQLTSNTGATIDFTGGVTAITTTTGNGFEATGGGTITVTGSNNSIASAGGIALNVTSTAIGNNALTFRSISANGGSNGIVLDGTGSKGLTVSGTGTPGSGGTIQHTTGALPSGTGVYLNNAQNVSLSWMGLNDHGSYAVYGTSVTGFTMSRTRVTGTNGVANSSGGAVYFLNLYGSASISNSYITGGGLDNVHVFNGFPNPATAALNRITFDSDTIFGNLGGSNINIAAYNTSVMKATIQNSRFTASRGSTINFATNENSSGDVIITGNNLSNNDPSQVSGTTGIFVGNASSGALTYLVQSNTVNGMFGSGIEVDRLAGGGGSMGGSIRNNTVGTSGVDGSGSRDGAAIFIGLVQNSTGAATHTDTVANNTVKQFGNYGIKLVNRGVGGGYLNAQVLNNNVSEHANSSVTLFPTGGIRWDIGAATGDDGKVCAINTGNVVSNAGSNGGEELRVRARFLTKVGVPGGGSDPTSLYLSTNTLTGTTLVNATSTTGFQNVCPPL